MRVNQKNNAMLPPLVGKCVLTLILATVGNVSAISLFDAPPPSLETFDPVVRSIWEKQQGPNAIDKFGELRNPLCIRVPDYPTPDAGSKARLPLAWHFDLIFENISTKGREQQTRQLEALVKVGLLKKMQVKTKVQGQIKDATRYSLTEKGWMASGSNNQASCFILGKQNYLGVYKFVQRNSYGQAGREVYEVHAKVGIGTSAELSPWARQPELHDQLGTDHVFCNQRGQHRNSF